MKFQQYFLFVTALVLVAVSSAAPALAETKQEKEIDRLFSLTPADFKNSALHNENDLDVVATITTEKGFQERRSLLNLVWEDTFLRAFINKKTGQTTYQVYSTIRHSGDWRYYETVNYTLPDGTIAVAPLINIARNVGYCSASSSCDLTEVVAFDVPETLLHKVAELYKAEDKTGWKFKYNAKSGPQYMETITGAEVVGMLQAVDEYKKLKNVPEYSPPMIADESSAPGSWPVAVLSPAEQLEKWAELLQKGMITNKEYAAKKKQLLGL